MHLETTAFYYAGSSKHKQTLKLVWILGHYFNSVAPTSSYRCAIQYKSELKNAV